jgi:regulatory protein
MKNTLEVKKSRPEVKKVKKPRKINLEYLENSGKFYLEKYPASIAHFRMVMTRKIRRSCLAHPDQNPEECSALLETIIQKFANAGFLNDSALSKGLLYSLKQRGWSLRKIKMSMSQKGLPKNLIDDALEETAPDHSDLASALKWIRKKRLGAFAKNEENQDRWLSSLGRAGFDYETSRKALSYSRDEIEELLSQAEA